MKETRVLETELRAITTPKGFKLEGYGASFNKFSEDLGGFVEKIKPGFFGNAIRSPKVVSMFNHDKNYLLGRTGAGTLRLYTDDAGLGYEVDLPDTTYARDLYESVDRRDVWGSSFGFTVAKNGDEWGETDRGFPLRSLVDCKRLWDVSPVTTPAYPETVVSARDAFSGLAEARGLDLDAVVTAHSAGALIEVVRTGDLQSKTQTSSGVSPSKFMVDRARRTIVGGALTKK